LVAQKTRACQFDFQRATAEVSEGVCV
jgi:hypothetical protein